jgi:hypothetical protein
LNGRTALLVKDARAHCCYPCVAAEALKLKQQKQEAKHQLALVTQQLEGMYVGYSL